MIDLHRELERMFSLYQAGPCRDDMADGFGIVGTVRDRDESAGSRWLRANGHPAMVDHGDKLRLVDREWGEVLKRSKREWYSRNRKSVSMARKSAYDPAKRRAAYLAKKASCQ